MSVYDRRQDAGNWPQRGRWNPADLPEWYRELLGEVAGALTAWRDDDRAAPLDPRFDPRVIRRRAQQRSCCHDDE